MRSMVSLNSCNLSVVYADNTIEKYGTHSIPCFLDLNKRKRRTRSKEDDEKCFIDQQQHKTVTIMANVEARRPHGTAQSHAI